MITKLFDFPNKTTGREKALCKAFVSLAVASDSSFSDCNTKLGISYFFTAESTTRIYQIFWLANAWLFVFNWFF